MVIRSLSRLPPYSIAASQIIPEPDMSEAAHTPAPASLAHLPLPVFASVMGLGGLALAWREAGHLLGAPAIVGEIIAGIATLVYVGLISLFLVKFIGHRKAFLNELQHPLRTPFASTVSIGAMLIAACLLPYAPMIANGLWIFAVVMHLVLAVWILRRWITVSMETHLATPAWFIPLVGNILAPVLGVKLGYIETSWALFGLSFFLWLVFMPVLVNRLVFHPELPARLLPTMAIFIAPPAVGFLAYNGLAGVDGLTRTLYWVAVFFVTMLASMAPRLAQLPFAMSWWAYTFPLAAFSLATMKFLGGWAGWAALGLATVIVAIVAVKTLAHTFAGHLLRPE